MQNARFVFFCLIEGVLEHLSLSSLPVLHLSLRNPTPMAYDKETRDGEVEENGGHGVFRLNYTPLFRGLTIMPGYMSVGIIFGSLSAASGILKTTPASVPSQVRQVQGSHVERSVLVAGSNGRPWAGEWFSPVLRLVLVAYPFLFSSECRKFLSVENAKSWWCSGILAGRAVPVHALRLDYSDGWNLFPFN